MKPLHSEITSATGDAPDLAPDLALIHGWGLGSAAWDEVLPLLAGRLRAHRVSLPGYDGSAEANAGDDALTAFDAAFDTTAAALAATLPHGCTLCGWSLGALLAMRAAQLAPGHFSHLVVVGATPCFTQRADWPQAQAPDVLDGFAAAVGEDASATRQRFIALFNHGDRRARAIQRTLTHALAEEAVAPSSATLRRGLDWLRRVDLRPALTQTPPSPHSLPPSLVIHGDQDPLMPLAAAHWLAQTLPAARLEVFAGAAHAPFANDAQRFATLLVDFCHAPTLA